MAELNVSYQLSSNLKGVLVMCGLIGTKYKRFFKTWLPPPDLPRVLHPAMLGQRISEVNLNIPIVTAHGIDMPNVAL